MDFEIGLRVQVKHLKFMGFEWANAVVVGTTPTGQVKTRLLGSGLVHTFPPSSVRWPRENK